MQQKPITIQPLTIQPLEDQSKKLEIKPLEVQPLETEQKSEDRSWLGKAWDYITEGAWQGPTGGEKVFDKLNRIRRTVSALSSPFPQVANDPQFGDRPLDRTGVTYNQILSGLQNSQLSPGNLALFAATGGASMAAKMGIPVVATGLNLIGRAAGAGFAYQGAKSMMDEDKGPVERVLGGAQAGLGLFAAAHETPKGTQPKIEPKVETPVVEPKIELNPEITGLKIRIARAEEFLKKTDITETERLVNQANLERLQGRLREVETGDFSASQAAQEVRSAEVRDIVKENIGKGGKPVFNRDQDVLQIQPLDKATIGPDIEPPINTWSLAEVRQATLDNDPIKASAATQELASRKAAFDASVDNLKEAGYEPVKSPTRGAIFIDEQGNTVRINPVTQAIEPLEADFAAGGVPPAREPVNKFKNMSDEELNGLLESKNPELVKNAVAELHDRYGATQEPQMARTDRGIKIGADISSLGRVLGSSLYQGDIGKIVTKELTQNAIDAVRNLGASGKVIVELADLDTPHIRVIDNGKGMTRAELETVFTDLGASGKRDLEEASGGFGLAKAAPLLGGEHVEVVSIVDEGGRRVKHEFNGTPEELLEGVDIRTTIVSKNTPTGVSVKTKIPKGNAGLGTYYGEKFIRQLSEHSIGFKGEIEIRDINKYTRPGYEHTEKFRSTPVDDTWNTTRLDHPLANIDIHIPPGTKYGPSAGVKFQALNNGMYQHTLSTGGWNELPGIPEKIYVDIKSKVKEGSPDYPWVANRESLRGPVLELVEKHIADTIINPAKGKRVAQLRQFYDNLPEMGGTDRKFFIYDVNQKLTPSELMEFQQSPTFINLANQVADTISQAMVRSPQEWQLKLEKIGFILDPELKGIHVPSPGAGKSAILINPFESMKATPDEASASIVHTILHEIAHIPGGGHDEDFAIRLSQIYEGYGRKRANNASIAIENAISRNGEYTPEIQELLQRYTESRGRTGTDTDILKGTGIGSATNNGGKKGIPGNSNSDRAGATPPRRFLDAIKTAIENRNAQTEIYRTEKGRRAARAGKINVTDRESYYKFKGQFSGKYSKVATEPVKLAEADVSSMISSIHKAPLNVFQKMNATDGLLKIINGSEVPNKYELKLLGEVFGQEFSNELGAISVDMLTAPVRGLPKAWNLLGIEMQALPKTLMSIWDTSAFLRQGIGLIHTKAAWKAFPSLFRNFTSQEFFDGTMKAIEGSKHYDLSQNKNVGLKLTDLGSNYTNREEAFMSRLAENYLPGVKASERSFVGYLDKVRMDTFNKMVDQQIDVAMGDLNLDPRYNLDVAKRIADYVNTASGRGSLPHIKGLGLDIELERSAVALNSILFSPRLIASRIQMLNPINYVKGPALVRRAYLKSALAIAGGGSIFANMAQLALGDRADVGNISTSSDYGKLRIGNTRIDPFAGFQQYIVLFNRLTQNETTASTSGRTFELGSHYGAATRTDLIEQFIVQKFAPINQLAYLLLQGKMPNGAPIDMQSEIAKRFIPLLFQDIYELSQDDPDLIPVAIPLAALGMGVQTYQPAKSARQNLLSNVNR